MFSSTIRWVEGQNNLLDFDGANDRSESLNLLRRPSKFSEWPNFLQWEILGILFKTRHNEQ